MCFFDAEGSAPLASSFSLTAGVASVLRTASLIALIVSRGVFAGTNSAYQLFHARQPLLGAWRIPVRTAPSYFSSLSHQ